VIQMPTGALKGVTRMRGKLKSIMGLGKR